MLRSFQIATLRVARSVSMIMTGPPALAFLPAICLSAFWFGGEGALLISTAAIPIIYLGLGTLRAPTWQMLLAREGASAILQRGAFEELTDQIFIHTEEVGWKSAIFCLKI